LVTGNKVLVSPPVLPNKMNGSTSNENRRGISFECLASIGRRKRVGNKMISSEKKGVSFFTLN